LSNLTNADHVMTPTVMRLAKLLGVEDSVQAPQGNVPPNVPTTKAAASAAAALAAL